MLTGERRAGSEAEDMVRKSLDTDTRSMKGEVKEKTHFGL